MFRSHRLVLVSIVSAACLVGAAGAQEVTLGQSDSTYPRLVNTTHIDPNTFVVGHPSSVQTHAGHANFEHPAVAHRAVPSEIDANTFIPRHPAGATASAGDESASMVASGH